MRFGTVILLIFSAIAAVIVATSVTSADDHGVYGCFLTNGEVFWDGYGHPAAFEGFGGPYTLNAILGPDCDEYPSRADYEEKRVWSPEYHKATPTPPPTPTPTPTPTPVPVIEPAWPYSPFCFWNDAETVLFCYG